MSEEPKAEVTWRRTSGRTWQVTIDRRSAAEREWDMMSERMYAEAQAACGQAWPWTHQWIAPPSPIGWL